MNISLPNLDADPELQSSAALRELSAVLLQYSNYCFIRARAMECRYSGDVRIAEYWEGQLDTIHTSLPDWARW